MFDRELVFPRLDPIREGFPNAFHFALGEPLQHEAQFERIVPLNLDLLSPMLVVQILAREAKKLFNEFLKGFIRLCPDLTIDCADSPRQRMRLEHHFRNHSKGPTAPSAK